MNELKESISPSTRKRLYVVFAFVGLVIGCCQTGWNTAELPQPLWLSITVNVFSFVATTFGFTAANFVSGRQAVAFEDASLAGADPTAEDYAGEPLLIGEDATIVPAEPAGYIYAETGTPVEKDYQDAAYAGEGLPDDYPPTDDVVATVEPFSP